MATKDLLSVAEVAELLGISKQAVYKRMEKDFRPFVVLVEKQKYLSYKVLRSNPDNHSTKSLIDSVEVKTLKKLVEILEKDNELKQQTIEQLQRQVKEGDRERADMTKELLQLAGKVGGALQSLTQGQLADKLIEGKLLMNGSADPEEPDEQPTMIRFTDEPAEKKSVVGFFKGLFSKQ